MKLRAKIPLLSALVIFSLVLIVYFYIQHVVLSSVERVEALGLSDSVALTNRILSDECHNLSVIAADWGAWNDTFDFAKGRAPEFAADNFQAATLGNLEIDFMLLLDVNGRVIDAACYDQSSGKRETLPANMASNIARLAGDITRESPLCTDGGVLLMGNRLFLVAGHPILHSDYAGPTAGSLFVGREVNAARLALWEKMVQRDISIIMPQTPDWPDGFSVQPAAISGSPDITIRAIDDHSICALHRLEALNSNETPLLKLTAPRTLMRDEKRRLTALLIILIATGMVSTIVLIILLDRYVLAPLSVLSREVAHVSQEERPTPVIITRGTGDIKELAGNINAALNNLAHSQINLLRIRTALDNASDAVVVLDRGESPIYVNQSFTALFGDDALNLLKSDGLRSIHRDVTMLPELFAVVQEDGSFIHEVDMTSKSGKLFHALLRATPVREDSGEHFGTLLIYTDITQRRALEEELRLLSQRDALTGVANRRAFNEALEEECRRASRTKSHVSLLIVDADHFKTINDTYGHPCGDKALQVLATLAQQSVRRHEDIVARYGGEEFGVILPATPKDAALDMAETLRQNVEQTPLPIGDEASSAVKLTISVGVATFVPKSPSDGVRLIRAADAALYRAKSEGRNCACYSDVESESSG